MSAVLKDAPQMVYQFKSSSRVPKGVTVDGILEERRRIVKEKGVASARASAEAILEDEEAYPNLRAWGPDTPEDAYRQAMEEGVRHAYGSIVMVEEVEDKRRSKAHEVRILYAVPDAATKEMSYEFIEIVAQDPTRRKWLVEQLQRDASAFTQKMEDVLAEIHALL